MRNGFEDLDLDRLLREAVDSGDCGYAALAAWSAGGDWLDALIGTSSALLADIVDRMAAAVG